MRKTITISILAVLFISTACLADSNEDKSKQIRHLTFDVPSHWTKTPGFWPEGSYSFLKQKGPEERILIFVRTSTFTRKLQARIIGDRKILRDKKKLTVNGPPRKVKLGAFQWVFIKVSGTVKNVWGKPESLYRLQYYTKEKDTLIEAYLEAMGKSFDKNDRKEFENFLTTIRLKKSNL